MKQVPLSEGWKVEIGSMNRRLVFYPDNREWSVEISRVDGKEIPTDYDSVTNVGPREQIREFIPNWEKLNGQHEDFFRMKNSSIQDGDYKMCLSLPEKASISMDDAIEQFKDFMDREEQEARKPEGEWSEDDVKKLDRLVVGVKELTRTVEELAKAFDPPVEISTEPIIGDAANIKTLPGLLCRVELSTRAIRKLTQAYKSEMNA